MKAIAIAEQGARLPSSTCPHRRLMWARCWSECEPVP